MTKNKPQETPIFMLKYGWIIAVLLIAAAALDYSGIVDITSIFPEKCSLSNKLVCLDYEVRPSEISLEINNGITSTIIVDSITVAGCSENFATEMPPREISPFLITNCNNGNNILKGEIILKYTEKRTDLQRTIYGKIKSKVIG
jgi:hypothetical protein